MPEERCLNGCPGYCTDLNGVHVDYCKECRTPLKNKSDREYFSSICGFNF